MAQRIKALQMTVDVAKIRIGSVRLFVAPVGTAWSPTGGAFNVDTPPTGWRDLGATAEDTTLEAGKTVFSLKTGILKTVKFQAVIGLEGKLTVNLHEFDVDSVADAMGSARPFNVLRASPTASEVDTVTSESEIDLVAGQGSEFTVGDRVAIGVLADLATSESIGTISVIASDTLTFSPALRTLPLVTDYVQKIYARKNALGTTVVRKHALLAAHDLVGGAQYVYLFPQVSAIESGFKPNLNEAKENVKLPITFTAYGVTDDDYDDTVVAVQFEIEANEA